MATRAVRRMTAVGAAAVLALTVGPVGPAAAAGGGGDVVTKSGQCTVNGTWKLKAKLRDGRIEVEFAVDINRNNRTFDVVLRDNGLLRFEGTRTTAAPSGSFTLERSIRDLPGADMIVARASRGTNVCRGSVTI